MIKFLSRFLEIVGAITVVIIIILIIIGIFAWLRKGKVPSKTVLEINFEKGVVEYIPNDPLARAFMGNVMKMRDIVSALEKASTDDRVAGLIVRIGTSDMGWAHIQEIRDAIIKFRGQGKTAIAFAETFGEFSAGNKSYYLATACDEIYLQPSGDIGLTGLVSETPFFKGTLNKLDVEPRLDNRKEYKTAKNILTETEYTEAHQEANRKIMESIFGQLVSAISEERGIPEQDVESLFDRGPFLGDEALSENLVDGLIYINEVYDKAAEKFGSDAEVLQLRKFLKRAGDPYKKGKTVALIYGNGLVMRGDNKYNPVSGTMTMGSDHIISAFRAAIDDKNVEAIIFRVNSRGGSYVASDAIWKETVRAREAGKPVIVTMGNVAGSGGYYVSMAANKIIAQPATITASIGVVGGKMITTDFWNKLGLSFDEIHTSEHATMWSTLHDYSPEEWARIQSWLDRIYEDFTNKVAQGRDLSLERVLEIAKGRVWTGMDAKDLGLIDALGGFTTAIEFAKKDAGISADESVKLKVFPKRRSFWDFLFGRETAPVDKKLSMIAIEQFTETVRPLAKLARELRLSAEPGALYMQNFDLPE